MVYQIIVGLLIPFCVQWIYYLPAGRVVGRSCHSLFSLYMSSVFSHLTFRLSLLYWNMFVCSDMLPPAISIVQCFRHIWLLWRSESQGLLDIQKNLWKSGFPRVSEYYFITKSSPRPISGSAPKLMSPSRPWLFRMQESSGFPGGAVVESLPANAGDTGSSPGLGRSHMPWSNQAREPQLLSLRVWSLCSAAREAATVRGPRTAMKSGPSSPQLEKALAQKRTAKN